jgi:hypothetical protein
MPALDFSNTNSNTGFTLMPIGTYNATIFALEQRVSNKSGQPYVNITIAIQDAPYNNRRVFSMASLQPHALFRMRELLGALGYDVSKAVEFEYPDLLGRALRVTLKHRAKPDGEMEEEVARFLPALAEGAATTAAAAAPAAHPANPLF